MLVTSTQTGTIGLAGQVVSVLAYYSNNQSLNLYKVYNFLFVKLPIFKNVNGSI